jgi:maltose O-acetyltransferase
MEVQRSLLSTFANVFARFWHPALVIPYARNPLVPALTKRLLNYHGATIADSTRIKRSFVIDNALTDENSTGDFGHLFIGANCYVGDEVYVDLADKVVIGDDVTISGRVSFITHADCNRSPWVAERFPRETGPIEVGEGAWLGFGATVMHGVTIGEESVVASGALVTDDVEPRSVYGGTPAKKMQELE